MKKNCPLEIKEQAAIGRWLEENGISLFTGTAQATWTGWSGIHKNKALHIKKGLPDLIICLSSDKTKTGRNHIIFMEVKRQIKSMSKIDKFQKAWFNHINSVQGDISAYICFGHESAIGVLESLLKPVEPLTGPITDKELLERLSKK